ncbi:hypothetical protein Tco_0728050 [Tanacetum coccineum]|uniref:Uncharacterized protein n=1 Tax=Tanacetum coccineum TaxID=301880 RepID=A0ABQ4YK23_9ASTR
MERPDQIPPWDGAGGPLEKDYVIQVILRVLLDGVGSKIDYVEELSRLHICKDLADTWAWVAPRPDSQPTVVAGALEVAEGVAVVDEGVLAVPAPIQVPQPPPVAAQGRTMPKRLARLEKEVHCLRGIMAEQRDVLDSMDRDFYRFTTWTITSLFLMIDRSRVRYTSYSDYRIPY